MSTLYVDNLQPNLGSRVMAAGHVVQVVQATSTTNTTLTAGGIVWTNAGSAASITPASTSSKILILHSASGIVNQATSSSLGIRIVRNLNDGNGDTVTPASRSRQAYDGNESGGYSPIMWDINYLDTPNTASQVTYKIQIAQENAGNVRFNDSDGSFSPTTSMSSLILMEIAQ